jgi:hypothetical protein
MPTPTNPCPRCGEETYVRRLDVARGNLPDEHAVVCTQCLYASPPAPGRDKAIEFHNQEPQPCQA